MASLSARKSTNSSPLLPVGAGAGAGAGTGVGLKRSSSKASLTEPKPKRKRTKAGCITCRVRGKVSFHHSLLSVFFPLFFPFFYRFVIKTKTVAPMAMGVAQSTRQRALRPRAVSAASVSVKENIL
jgi:hypothetical protein